ncbi:MAG: hypothetical protein AAF480_00100 [Actinomycetota bacterium]
MQNSHASHTTPRLPVSVIAPGYLLMAIYAMLSFIALFDQTSFFESMDIPIPANEFMIWSWAGKNTALLVVMSVAFVTRLRFLVVTTIAMLLVMQAGDVNAGAQSGTNVFVTWIAFALTALLAALVAWDWRRSESAVRAA